MTKNDDENGRGTHDGNGKTGKGHHHPILVALLVFLFSFFFSRGKRSGESEYRLVRSAFLKRHGIVGDKSNCMTLGDERLDRNVVQEKKGMKKKKNVLSESMQQYIEAICD
eukprot:scaffold12749_cov107-Cylindrotheca_fusiformis.AAC.4